MTLEEKTVPRDFSVNEEIASEIRENLKAGKLPCAAAFAGARRQAVTPLVIGQTADVLNIHLTRCQLGLFGYGDASDHTKGWDVAGVATQPVPEGVQQAIREGLDEDGNVACRHLWEVAKRFGISRMLAGYLADQLGLRIAPCQLGAF